MEISIKKPCHENWSDMTPNEQGAFCGKCVKTVVDFSTRSLEEIKEFFTGREQQKICGRFEEKQLTALSFDAFFERFRRFEFTKRLAVILFFTFGVWLFGASSASAQSNEHVKGDVRVQEPILNGNVKTTPAGKDKINCTKPNESKVMIMGGPKVAQEPQSIKMGKVAPVKQVPAKDSVKKVPVKEPLKPKPVKKEAQKQASVKTLTITQTFITGSISAPAPKQKPK
jgi:hypothetical protein